MPTLFVDREWWERDYIPRWRLSVNNVILSAKIKIPIPGYYGKYKTFNYECLALVPWELLGSCLKSRKIMTRRRFEAVVESCISNGKWIGGKSGYDNDRAQITVPFYYAEQFNIDHLIYKDLESKALLAGDFSVGESVWLWTQVKKGNYQIF